MAQLAASFRWSFGFHPRWMWPRIVTLGVIAIRRTERDNARTRRCKPTAEAGRKELKSPNCQGSHLMLSQVVQDALNQQINSELSASYTYLAMSAYCDRQNFRGSARWLRLQSTEEYGHAMKLLDFMLARDGKVRLKAIAEPAMQFQNITSVFEQALEQETEVSASDRSALRTRLQGKGIRCAGRVAMVLDRAGRRRTDRRDRRQVPPLR